MFREYFKIAGIAEYKDYFHVRTRVLMGNFIENYDNSLRFVMLRQMLLPHPI